MTKNHYDSRKYIYIYNSYYCYSDFFYFKYIVITIVIILYFKYIEKKNKTTYNVVFINLK